MKSAQRSARFNAAREAIRRHQVTGHRWAVLLVLFSVALVGFVAVNSMRSSTDGYSHRVLTTSTKRTTVATYFSVVARARHAKLPIYSSPLARLPRQTLQSPTALGQPLVLLVSDFRRAPKWLRVYLPSRPNESQGWVRMSSVTLSTDDFEVHVHLAAHKMSVTDGARLVISVPIGEGRSALPTPTGTYFIVDLLKQPDPAGEYGPYAFGLSAFSDVLESFGGGPGQIGIHGTSDPTSIGVSVSHGCIRLTNSTITELAHLLPLGTRVVISA